MFSAGTGQRHHPHFDAARPPRAPAYELRVCGNELDGFVRVSLREGECGSLDALTELLEERLHLGLIDSLALRVRGEDGWEFAQLNEVSELPPAEPPPQPLPVVRVTSKHTSSIRYPGLQSYHHHPYKLHDAATAGDTDAIKSMMGGGADASEQLGFGRRTALHNAAAAGRGGAAAELLDAGAAAAARGEQLPSDAVHALDRAGRTPLHLAARHGHVEVLLQLLATDHEPDMVTARERARVQVS
jgi:hypothetical protein